MRILRIQKANQNVDVQIPVPKGGGSGGPQKLQHISFFGGAALEIFQFLTQTPQKNATLFWDERSVWCLLKARKQQFLGSVVIILVVFEPFPFRGTSFWRGLPGASGRTVLVGVSPYEHLYFGPLRASQPPPPSKVQQKMEFHWGTPPQTTIVRGED